jgi:hypothetical protein
MYRTGSEERMTESVYQRTIPCIFEPHVTKKILKNIKLGGMEQTKVPNANPA